jgi:hypothetical protein
MTPDCANRAMSARLPNMTTFDAVTMNACTLARQDGEGAIEVLGG